MAKRPSRAQERQRLLDEAAAVQVPGACDVVVVGGGAAGLAAAIAAAERGAAVVMLERDLVCGRTILATGNGRCNFANVSLDAKRFNDPAFVASVVGARWLDDVLGFFRASGMRWCLEDDRLYPLSRQAASVRNVLLRRAREAGVVLAPAREVVGVETHGSGALVTYRDPSDEGTLRSCEAAAVVVATGGGTLVALAGLGLETKPCAPVLCPLACEPSPLADLDGRRAHVQAFLTKAGSFFPSFKERGEVLFRNYGLSGILTFDLSRRTEPGDLVEVDLAPDVSPSDLRQIVDPFMHGTFEPGIIDGIVDPEVAAVLEQLARERWYVPWPEHEAPTSDSEALMNLVKKLPFVVTGPAETERAQVTRGGLANGQFACETLASRRHPWLFACGEALDVDADCGGFNLAWAWKSGMVAGKAAAEEARR